MTDSSPQAGEDWLWTSYTEIREADIEGAFEAVLRLQEACFLLVARCVGETTGIVDQQQLMTSIRLEESLWLRHTASIQAKLFHVVPPPQAMGSGHRSTAHKCGHLAYAWSLSFPSGLEINTALDEVVSHTSDLGVEHGLAQFHVALPSSLLPKWVELEVPQPEHFDLHVDISKSAIQPEDFEIYEPMIDAGAADADMPASDQATNRPQRFMPWCFTIAGALAFQQQKDNTGKEEHHIQLNDRFRSKILLKLSAQNDLALCGHR